MIISSAKTNNNLSIFWSTAIDILSEWYSEINNWFSILILWMSKLCRQSEMTTFYLYYSFFL